MRTTFLAVLIAGTTVLVGGCAGMLGREPLQVTVADIESLPSEGLELRMLVKLRVQNPNDAPLEYDGLSLRLEVQGSTFATGVSDARGTVPRFGEALISVPLTASVLRITLSTISAMSGGKPPEKLDYRMDGKLNSPGFGSTSFRAQGELKLPGSLATQ